MPANLTQQTPYAANYKDVFDIRAILIVALFVGSLPAAARIRFMFHRAANWFAIQPVAWAKDPKKFEQLFPLIYLFITLTYISPILGGFILGSEIYKDGEQVKALVVMFLLPSVALIINTIVGWWFANWRINSNFYNSVGFTFLLLMAFVGWVTFASFTYEEFTAFCIGITTFPILEYFEDEADDALKEVVEYKGCDILKRASFEEDDALDDLIGNLPGSKLAKKLGNFVGNTCISPRVKRFITRFWCLIVAYAVMVAYAVITSNEDKPGRFHKNAGWVIWMSLIVTDITMILAARNKVMKLSDSFYLLIFIRFVLFIFHGSDYFIGHTICFLVLNFLQVKMALAFMLPQKITFTMFDRAKEMLREPFIHTGVMFYIVYIVDMILTKEYIKDYNSLGTFACLLSPAVLCYQIAYKLYKRKTEANVTIVTNVILGSLIQGVQGVIEIIDGNPAFGFALIGLPIWAAVTLYAYTQWKKNDYELFVASGDASKAGQNKLAQDDGHGHTEGEHQMDELEQGSQKPAQGGATKTGGSNDAQPTDPNAFKKVAVKAEDIYAVEPPACLGRLKILIAATLSIALLPGMQAAIWFTYKGDNSTFANSAEGIFVSVLAWIWILGNTFIFREQWFNTFKISPSLLFNAVLVVAAYALWALLQAEAQTGTGTEKALFYIVVFVWYASLVMAYTGYSQYLDSGNMSFAVSLQIGLFCLLNIGMGIVMIVTQGDNWFWGAIVLNLACAVFCQFLSMLYKEYTNALVAVTWIGLIVSVILISEIDINVPAPTYLASRQFVAYTVFTIFFIVFNYYFNWKEEVEAKGLMIDLDTLLPNYAYMPAHGKRDPMVTQNDNNLRTVLNLILVAGWGCGSILLTPTRWLGIGVVLLSICLLLILWINHGLSNRIEFREAVDIMGGEDNDMYDEVIARALEQAKESQAPRRNDDYELEPSSSDEEAPSDHEEEKKEDGDAGNESEEDLMDKFGDMLEDVGELATKLFSLFTSQLKGLDIDDWTILGLDPRSVNLDVAGYIKLEAKFAELMTKSKEVHKARMCGEPTVMNYNGYKLYRNQTLALLLRLENEMTLSYQRCSKFLAQFEIEVRIGARAARKREEHEMLTMLREKHYFVTPEYLRDLDPYGKVWKKISDMLDVWQEEQKKLKADLEKKREAAALRERKREQAAAGVYKDPPPKNFASGGQGDGDLTEVDLTGAFMPELGDASFKPEEFDASAFKMDIPKAAAK